MVSNAQTRMLCANIDSAYVFILVFNAVTLLIFGILAIFLAKKW